MSDKKYTCNDEDYRFPTGHWVGLDYEMAIHESDIDDDDDPQGYYHDILKFKFCPNCGEKLI